MMNVASKTTLLLRPGEWRNGVIVSLLAGLLALTVSFSISMWISVVVFATTFVVFHMAYASAFVVPFPHIAVLIAALQYTLAAWFSYYFPPANPVFDSSPVISQYLMYGGPVVLALCCGWALSLIGLSPRVRPNVRVVDGSSSLVELDVLILVGFASAILSHLIAIPAISFAAVLIGNLRYVGVYGRMLLRASGWRWRLALVISAELLIAADQAMFHPLLLWTMWSIAMWMHCYRPRPRAVFAACAVGLLLMPALQEAKWRLRGNLAEDEGVIAETSEDATPLTRVSDWARFMVEGLGHTLDFGFSYEFLQDTAARYNQGWIVSRVMAFVPELQPYARGETIKEAVRNALIPRMLDAEKATAGGRENMLLYAGMEMSAGTSMNLGYAGEMYANFGAWGGIVGCGAYALFFGLVFRFFCRRAFEQPMWWAFVPYIFFSCLKAEDGIYEVLNWTTKSCVVVFGVCLLFPQLRRVLSSSEKAQNAASGMPLPT